MGESGAGGHDIVDEEDGASTNPFGAFHGEGVLEVVLPVIAGEACLMFGVEDPKKRAAVGTTVEPPGERDGKQGALVVAALPFAAGMEGDGHDNVDGGELQLCADRAFKKIHEIFAKPNRLSELEVLNELIRGFVVDDGATGELVGGWFRLAGFADEVVSCLRRDEPATDSTGTSPLVEGECGETVRADMASVTIGDTVA